VSDNADRALPRDLRSFDLCADGGIGALKPWLRARGGASADANEREQGEEARQAQVYGFRMAARIAFSRSITPCGIQAPSSAARNAAILRTSRRMLATRADSPSLSEASAAASPAGLRAGASDASG
jgi:hypothetical protein